MTREKTPLDGVSDEVATAIGIAALVSLPMAVVWMVVLWDEPSSAPMLLAMAATFGVTFGLAYLFRRELTAIARRFRRR